MALGRLIPVRRDVIESRGICIFCNHVDKARTSVQAITYYSKKPGTQKQLHQPMTVLLEAII
jgi:hypothetical protein